MSESGDAGKAPNSRVVYVLLPELAREDVLNVSRKRAYELAARPDFPEPEARTVSGAPIYKLTRVRAWNKRRNRSAGRPRHEKE